jgi:hypothetical protein
MTTFDETQHPRATTGTFTEKDQSAPELTMARVAPTTDLTTALPASFGTGAEAEETLRAEHVSALSIADKEALIYSADWKVRAAIAQSTPELQDEFLDDEVAEVIIAAGVAPALATAFVAAKEAERTTDPDRLDELADVDSDMMHSMIARNPNTRTATLVKMSDRSGAGQAHLAVSVRLDCPPELLEKMAGSQFPIIRQNVAGHQASTPGTLRSLGRDANQGVLNALGQNPNTPSYTLRRLFDQSGSIASNAAHSQLKFRAAAAEEEKA